MVSILLGIRYMHVPCIDPLRLRFPLQVVKGDISCALVLIKFYFSSYANVH